MADDGLFFTLTAPLKGCKASSRRQVAKELLGRGREAIALPCNVSVREEVEALAEATLARWGRIDALVCNAAVNPYFGPLSGLSDEAFAKIMTANVLSNLWLCNQVIPQMAESRFRPDVL